MNVGDDPPDRLHALAPPATIPPTVSEFENRFQRRVLASIGSFRRVASSACIDESADSPASAS